MEEKFSILCVDDEEDILSSLKRVLLRKNYNIFTASSGNEGLEVLNENPIDLVISDQRMPNMSGFEFLRQVREKYPNVMRIMLSGYSDFDSLVKSINEGEIFRFVSKPWDNDKLCEAIHLALEQKSIINDTESLLKNIRIMFELIKGFLIETSYEKNTIILKVTTHEQYPSNDNIVEFLKFIFETLGIDKEQQIQIMSSAITKTSDKIVFEINMGKGVVLKIEIPIFKDFIKE